MNKIFTVAAFFIELTLMLAIMPLCLLDEFLFD